MGETRPSSRQPLRDPHYWGWRSLRGYDCEAQLDQQGQGFRSIPNCVLEEYRWSVN